MDRGEPALIPQWLKNNGSGGSGRQPYFSSSSRSDRFTMKHARGASSANNGAAGSDRIGAAHFNRHSNGKGSSHLQSYRSFSRSNQNGVHEDSLLLHDKEKLNVRVHRNSNRLVDFDGGLRGKFQKEKLQRSQSMNGWRDENSIVSDYLSKGRYNCDSSGKVLLGRGGDTNKSIKSSIEQDFPSLVSEDLRLSSDVGRVPSPGFQRQATAFSDGWTSALAEAPGVKVNGSLSSLAYSQITSGIPSPFPQSAIATNMAEAVAQTPAHARTHPEISVETQRLEELAVKMSKQLIPMTPVPRSHTNSSLERSKTRVVQQQAKLSPSLGGGQTVRVTSPRLDTAKLSYPCKLQILKPLKDLNGVSIPGKESSCSPNGASVPSSPLSVASSTCGSPGSNSFNQQNIASLERKPTVVQANAEKRPSSKAQSRSDFFKLLKKKSFTGSISPSSDDGHSLSTVLERSDFSGNDSVTSVVKQEIFPVACDSDTVHENGGEVDKSGNDVCDLSRQQTLNGEVQSFYSVEEEAAFLHSLGWEESAVEEEGLTEEEISSFLHECSKLGLSPKSLSARKMELQLISNQKSCIGLSCGQTLCPPYSES